MTDYILALDYGGTKLSASLIKRGATLWSDLKRHASPSGHDAAYEQAAMQRMVHDLLGKRRPVAIGVSFGGPVLQSQGLVILSHHIAGWDNTPLAGQLQAEFGAPTAIANDANAGALGEWRYGAAQGCASVFYATVSTGIGGGWVLGGAIFDGADGMAGEIGHVVVNPGGAPCVCGKRGCLEAEACGTAIGLAARHRLTRHPENGAALLALAGEASAITAQHVARAAQAGDPMALDVLDHAARMLGVGLGGVINLMNPQRIIIGGGVTKSGERWLRLVREQARYHALPQMRVDIQLAALGDDAPLWGAVALAEQALAEGKL
jgi:glucokinase